MNATTEKTASSLTITEKRTHRPGGCVGIFFQLFDWNRRFAKKKLFSKKLLPPARAKQVSKKFGGDEKMPKAKFHLIADENSGGFPNVRKNGNRGVDVGQKHEMRAPGLVARLMGLETMPAVHRDKLKKASFTENCDSREQKFVDNHIEFNREDVNLEKGVAKIESRPQKLQKTGSFERRVVTRFGAEALQIKGVLSRSRKHHHPKFVSPVKSPRIPSVRNVSRTSRLIDAATKILEPGLQATNRAKCALTYSSSTHYSSKDEVMTEGMRIMSPDLSNQSCYDMSVGKSLMGQASCQNCGNLVEVVDSGANAEERPFIYLLSASTSVNASSQGLGKSNPRPPMSSLDQERDVVFQRSQDQPVSLAVQAQDNIRCSSESITDRKPLSREGQGQGQGQAQWHLSSPQCKPQKDEPSSIAFKQRTQTQNQMPFGRDRIPPRAKLNSLQGRRVSSAANVVTGAKDFVALNRNLSGRTRPRVPSKVDNSAFDTDRNFCSQRDDSLSQLRAPVRKRRTIGVNGQVESTGFANSTLGKQRNARCNVGIGKEMGIGAHSMDQTCIKNRSSGQGGGNRANINKDSNVISFTFNSPLKQRTAISEEMKEKRKDRNEFSRKGISHQRKSVLHENDGKTSLRKQLPLRGDALGALLEQKLKELTSQEEDELTTGGTLPKRSAAMILQELISALIAEQPISQDCHVLNTDIVFQAEAKAEGTSVGFARDGDHLSPGSVLDASFSNDSCFSSSLDENSGRRMHLDSLDYYYDQLQTAEPDADLLDSATSSNRRSTGCEMVTDLVNHISRMLHGIHLAGTALMERKLTHAKEVILNAELVFGNVTLNNSEAMKDLLVGPSLLDKLENLAGAMWSNFDCLLSFEETKEGELRRFLFDCLIEFLDSKYGQYCNSGLKARRQLPSCVNAEMLTREVGNEIRRWTHLAGMIPDEIIEWEMSHSLGKWTDFDIEAFETGYEIGWDILQILIEETVIDLWECRLVSV